MSSKEFIQSVRPMARELVCECIKMPDEVYQEYKEDMKQYIDRLNTSWICGFYNEIFLLIEKYRQRNEEKETSAQWKNLN